MSTLAIDSRLKLQLLLWYGVLALAVLFLGVFLAADLYFVAFLVGLGGALISLPYHAQISARVALATYSSPFIVAFVPGFPDLWLTMGVLGWTGVAIAIALRQVSPFAGQTIRRNKWVFIGLVGYMPVMLFLMRHYGSGLSTFGAGTGGGRPYMEQILTAVFPLLFVVIEWNEKTVFRLIVLQFLLSLFYVIGDFVMQTGKFESLLYVFKSLPDSFMFSVDARQFGLHRIQSLQIVGLTVITLVLLYHPLRAFLSRRASWIFPVVGVALVAGSLSGHRTFYLFLVMLFFFLALAQRFFTVRNQLVALGVLVIALAFCYLFTDSLPLTTQRAISFLPGIRVNSLSQLDADNTATVRVQLFKTGLDWMPRYLWVGRGFHRWNPFKNVKDHPLYATMNFLADQGLFACGPLGLMVDTGLPGCVFMFMVLFGGSLAAGRVMGHLRRHGYEDRFALACGIVAAGWFSNLIEFIFIQGNAESAMKDFGLPCGVLMMCDLLLRQRSERGAGGGPTALAGAGA